MTLEDQAVAQPVRGVTVDTPRTGLRRIRDGVLVVTQLMDPHADFMVDALTRRGADLMRLNTDQIPEAVTVSVAPSAQSCRGELAVMASGRVLDLSSVRSVWWRRPSPIAAPKTLTLREREFSEREFEQLFQGLWECLAGCRWVSHPSALRRARWKMGQLQRASSLGFAVPDTLITNDPSVARRFWREAGGDIVYKTLAQPLVSDPGPGLRDPADSPLITFTTRVTREHLAAFDTIRSAPVQLQRFVPKKAEYRVTVIGRQLFTARITANNDDEVVDWRIDSEAVTFQAGILPERVGNACLALVRSYGLAFSAIDLIERPDGEFVFIESNPNGQFVFVEQRVPELRMIDALAELLLSSEPAIEGY